MPAPPPHPNKGLTLSELKAPKRRILEPLFDSRMFKKKGHAPLRAAFKELAKEVERNLPERNGTGSKRPLILVNNGSMARSLGLVLEEGAGVTKPLKGHDIVTVGLGSAGIPKEVSERTNLVVFEPHASDTAHLTMMDHSGMMPKKTSQKLKSSAFRLMEKRELTSSLASVSQQLKKGSLIALAGAITPSTTRKDTLSRYSQYVPGDLIHTTVLTTDHLPKDDETRNLLYAQGPREVAFYSLFRIGDESRKKSAKKGPDAPEIKRQQRTYEEALSEANDHVYDKLRNTLRAVASRGGGPTEQEKELIKRMRSFRRLALPRDRRIEEDMRIKEEVKDSRAQHLLGEPDKITKKQAKAYAPYLRPHIESKFKLKTPLRFLSSLGAREATPALIEEFSGHLDTINSALGENLRPVFDEEIESARAVIERRGRQAYERMSPKLKDLGSMSDPAAGAKKSIRHLEDLKKTRAALNRHGIDFPQMREHETALRDVLRDHIGRRIEEISTNIDKLASSRDEKNTDNSRAEHAKKLYRQISDGILEIDSILSNPALGVPGKKSPLLRPLDFPELGRMYEKTSKYLDWADRNGYDEHQFAAEIQNPSAEKGDKKIKGDRKSAEKKAKAKKSKKKKRK